MIFIHIIYRREVWSFMEISKKSLFPTGFFSKSRPEVTPSKNPDDKIIPIKWSKEVESGQKKAIVILQKKKN